LLGGLVLVALLAIPLEGLRRRSFEDATDAVADGSADEYLERGYRRRWDLFAASLVVLAVVLVADRSSTEDARSLIAVFLTAGLVALYWNTYAAFESDQLLTPSQRSSALATAGFLLAPLLLNNSLDRAVPVLVAVAGAGAFVLRTELLSQRARQIHEVQAANEPRDRSI